MDRFMQLALPAIVVAVSIPASAAGDPARGASAFNACMACHSIKANEHMTGPSLSSVWMRKAGTAPGFTRYSDALKSSGLTWDAQTLDRWLTDPAKLVPGNAMAFSGTGNAQARQDLTAYLKAVSEGNSPAAPAHSGHIAQTAKLNLKEAPPEGQVKGIAYCGDTYTIETGDGKTQKIWEFNLRLKTDSSKDGPAPGKPVVIGAGMRGDRASVVFASPTEISKTIKASCP